MNLRLRVLLAIAWRDLSSQLRGRRGWVLPVVSAILLGPIALIPWPETPERLTWHAVSGEVPAEILEVPHTRQVVRWGHRFKHTDEGLRIRTPGLPQEFREVLDEGEPPFVTREIPPEQLPLPGRTMFLALLASSLLTGSVSESVPGERGRGTLEALLTAAVTRGEVVLGKWLAWSAFGAFNATAAGALAVLMGYAPLGPWMIALPTVPLGTVALGMFLVRRARDVVGGATVSLRVLPAVLSILGLVAWFIGLSGSVFGALVPLGGALVSAGATWDGWATPVLSAATTLVATAILLALTARDLERPEQAQGGMRRTQDLLGAAWVLVGWWAGVGSAVAWYPAGNPRVSRDMPVWPGLLAGTLALLTLMSIAAARTDRPGRMLGLKAPPLPATAAALLFGALLGPVLRTSLIGGDLPEALGLLMLRVDAGLSPLHVSALGLGTLLIHELVFRGWMQQRLGPLAATVVYAVAVSPVDPLRGLLVGGMLSALTVVARGSVVPALMAHLVASVVALAVPELPVGASVGLAALAVLVGVAWAAVDKRRT